MKWKLLVVLCSLLGLGLFLHGVVHADTPSNFNLQVSPSPLVATVQPGSQSKLQLRVYDSGTNSEDLKIATRSFSFNSTTGQVNLSDNTPASISSWISFSAPMFSVQPGQWFTQTITLNVPKDAGFSYSFALVISPQNSAKPITGARTIKGSLAVFTLLNVDRPGAKSSLQVVSFTSSRRLYEYLPATLRVRIKNDGNTIVQPYGNIFVGRNEDTKSPLATLTVNADKGYILPGTERTLSAQWDDGFATYQTTKTPDGSTAQHFTIDWSNLSHFRIGKYTARLVAVYSQDNRDIPIEGTVSFWVIPWRAILAFIVIITGLWVFARWRGKRRTEKAVRRALAQAEAKRKAEQA